MGLTSLSPRMGEDLGPELQAPSSQLCHLLLPPSPSVDTGAGPGDRTASEILHNVMESLLHVRLRTLCTGKETT